ncbi:hypothetical protein LTR53_014146 [Teratosphaeriaceae sp. CCFEE 6253]|nr:hypothetical protein LTR53_014146 [Teratosphaeriaceae sp. CCFEE 6253]
MQADEPDEASKTSPARPPTPPGFREQYGSRSPQQCRLVCARSRRRHVEVLPIDSAGDIFVLDIVRMPTSSLDHLAAQFTHSLRSLELEERWPGFVASRIGHSVTLDLAATALVKAQEYAATRYTGSVNSSLRPYTEAFVHLRADIAAPGSYMLDDTAVVVALLAVVERLLSPGSSSTHQHLKALYTILAARGPQPRASKSNIIAAIYYDSWTVTFLRPCLIGVASPFDDPLCHALEPVGRTTLDPVTVAVRWCSHQLFLRLPTLIVLVRRVRATASADDAAKAAELAMHLLELNDVDAEVAFVKQIRTIETQHARDRKITPTSYAFDCAAQYDAAMYFWAARLLLFRLCRTLNTISPASDRLDVSPSTIRRTVSNLFRSWQYTLGASLAGRDAVAISSVGIWGALRDSPDLFAPELQGRELQTWVLEDLNFTMMHKPGAARREMDMMADLFVGGKIDGRVVEVCSL